MLIRNQTQSSLLPFTFSYGALVALQLIIVIVYE